MSELPKEPNDAGEPPPKLGFVARTYEDLVALTSVSKVLLKRGGLAAAATVPIFVVLGICATIPSSACMFLCSFFGLVPAMAVFFACASSGPLAAFALAMRGRATFGGAMSLGIRRVPWVATVYFIAGVVATGTLGIVGVGIGLAVALATNMAQNGSGGVPFPDWLPVVAGIVVAVPIVLVLVWCYARYVPLTIAALVIEDHKGALPPLGRTHEKSAGRVATLFVVAAAPFLIEIAASAPATGFTIDIASLQAATRAAAVIGGFLASVMASGLLTIAAHAVIMGTPVVEEEPIGD